jgi:hypothetical protein
MFRILCIAAALATAACAQDVHQLASGVLQQSKLAAQAATQHDRTAALDHIRQGWAFANQILEVTPPSTPRPVLVRIFQDSETPQRVSLGRLDISSAAIRFENARSAVQRGDWAAAGSDLRAISESLLHTAVEGNLPLLEARQNLRLARIRVEEHRYGDAAAPLRAAALDLADYEKLPLGPLDKNAEYFREQIGNYAHTVAEHHHEASRQIDYWLGFIDRWYKRAAS